jgi:short-subunit dehydrogenase
MSTALVTGASAGIGAEFARQLAGRGHDLVLVARDSARLEASRADLKQRFDVSVEVLPADLCTDGGCAEVVARIADPDRPIEVLVNNAGFGMYRKFGDAEVADEERQLDLNVRAVLRLTHAAVRAMTARNSGRIINVSSVAGFVPRGGNATYSAAKAYVTMLSEALSVQLQGTGVKITAVCPGFTHTEFHQRANADMSHVPDRMWLDAATVVAEGLADSDRGEPISIPSRRYKTLVTAVRAVPRPVLRRIMARRAF